MTDNDINPVKIDVIQGGLVNTRSSGLRFLRADEQDRLHHRNGTLSTARDKPGTGSAGAPLSASAISRSSHFGGRRNPDRQGFAAFGQVVHGMDVRAIWKLEDRAAPCGMGAQKLTPPIRIVSAKRIVTR